MHCHGKIILAAFLTCSLLIYTCFTYLVPCIEKWIPALNNLNKFKSEEAIIFQMIGNNAVPIRNYTMPGCSCHRYGLNVEHLKSLREVHQGTNDSAGLSAGFNFVGDSFCSDYASQRGGGQKVISYTFFTEGNVDTSNFHFTKYLLYLNDRAADIPNKYPGWLMRVYHNTPADDVEGNRFMCNMFCNYPHVDMCHIQRLPGLGNLSQANVIGRAWRFAVLGDPTVSAFMCRDSDSLIIDREVAAVNQWLSSEESFHVIRDHIYHPEIMLAGLWGGRNKDLNMTRKMLDEMFALPPRYHRTYDQEILARLVWPRIKNDVMQHDSYHCLKQGHGEGKTAFPTQRVNGTFCGFFAYKRKDMVKLTKPCPEACRPKEHKDWTLC